MAKPNPRNANGHRRRQLRARVIAHYDLCHLCGRAVDKTLRTPHPMSPEVDEIIPIADNGDPLAWTNVALAHRICNQRRGRRSVQAARALIAGNQPQAPPQPKPSRAW